MTSLLLLALLSSLGLVYSHFSRHKAAPSFGHVEYKLNSFHQQLQLSANNSFGINVLEFGAKGDGTSDNTAAFTKALNAATDGGYVYVPTGRYLFKGTLTIPSGVTLIGTYIAPPYHVCPKNQMQGITLNDIKDGSVLAYDGGINDIFITMKESSFIKGFSIIYPKQVANNKVPLKYNATISITGPNVAILDMELINPYIGITMSPGPASARHYIARVQGGPVYVGILIDKCHDIGRTEDVHFKAAWYADLGAYSSNQIVDTIIHWSGLYGVSFMIGDTDWEFMFNTFSWGYAIGYQFVETETGSPNGNFLGIFLLSSPLCTDCTLIDNDIYLGISADATTNASIQVDSTKAWGISITNGEFVARANSKEGLNDDNDATGVVISKTNVGNVHLSNCIFFGPSDYIARIYGDSSTSFENCEFHEWNADNPAIYSEAGIVKVIGNNFYQKESKHIYFKSGTEKGIVVGNSFADTEQIQHDTSVKYAEAANL